MSAAVEPRLPLGCVGIQHEESREGQAAPADGSVQRRCTRPARRGRVESGDRA